MGVVAKFQTQANSARLKPELPGLLTPGAPTASITTTSRLRNPSPIEHVLPSPYIIQKALSALPTPLLTFKLCASAADPLKCCTVELLDGMVIIGQSDLVRCPFLLCYHLRASAWWEKTQLNNNTRTLSPWALP